MNAQAMASIEKTVVQKHFSKLAQAVQDPLHLAHELYQEGILTQTLIGRIRGMSDKLEKNSLLMETVLDQTSTPERLQQFLAILKRDATLISITESMQSLYGKF